MPNAHQPDPAVPAAPQARLVDRCAELVRAVIGVPDYERYRQHMAEHHPGQPVMSEREFAEDRLQAKYSRPGQRCC